MEEIGKRYLKGMGVLQENGHNWQLLFRPCSTQRLFLPNTLPDVDAVLYADTDVIFLHPIEDFWRMFYAMNEYQMAGMAPETENLENNYYLKRKSVPPPCSYSAIVPFRLRGAATAIIHGLNAGLMMMNLTRLRAFDLEDHITRQLEEFEERISFEDQDLLNILFAQYPQGLFTFSCRWNYRREHCLGGALCADGPIAAIHASRKVVHHKIEPAFVALHTVMANFKLGQNLVDDFIAPLRTSLRNTNLTGCTKELRKQLHLLRLAASRVDNKTAQAAAANEM
nr:glucoside xylosyltransferase 1-like [Rhipicephalus microplus]